MSGTAQPRRRKPRWGLIMIFFGIALAAFLWGFFQLLRPGIVRTTHSDGIVAFDEWQFPFAVELEGEPQLTELEDGTVQLTGVYAGSQEIDPVDAQLSCELLDMPPTWSLVECTIPPNRPEALRITIQR